MPCPSPLLTLLFSKKEQNYRCLVSKTCQTLLMVFVVMAKADPRGRMRGMHPPTSRFKNVFDAYNFSIISNFFDSDKLYDISTHIENVRRKCSIFGEAFEIGVKKFKQNLPKNYSKSTKIAITACKF